MARPSVRACAALAAFVALVGSFGAVTASPDLGPPSPFPGVQPARGELDVAPCHRPGLAPQPTLGEDSGLQPDWRPGLWFHCGLLSVTDVGPAREISVLIASSDPDIAVPPGRRLLIYHPGGPGVSAVDAMLAAVPDLSLGRWSIVTWDGATSARGLGPCGAETEAFGHERPPQTLEAAANRVAEECLTTGADSGRGAWTAAWELEQIRQALHVSSVDMLMHSYGTAIGEAYVRAYPGRSDRVVLDGPLALEVEWADRVAAVAAEVAATTEAMLSTCTQDLCGAELAELAASGGYKAVRQRILEAAPMVGVGAVSLTGVDIDQATLAALRSAAFRPDYLGALRAAIDGQGSRLWTLSFRYFNDVDRNVFYQSMCVDLRHPTDDIDGYVVGEPAIVATFASEFAPCIRSPIIPGPESMDPGAHVLLVASRGDPVTPATLLDHAPRLRAAGATCVTDVAGHTSYPTPAIAHIVDQFLIDGAGDAAVLRCAAELRNP